MDYKIKFEGWELVGLERRTIKRAGAEGWS